MGSQRGSPHKGGQSQNSYTTKMWRAETNAGCKKTLTIYTKEVTYMLARRQKFDGSGTTAILQSVISI